MKLYLNPISPDCRKVSAVRAHLELPCETHNIQLRDGENWSESYLAINPNAMVPALTDGDLCLWESNAIMAYMCSKVDTPLWPDTPARYDVMRWMCWELAHWGRWTTAWTFEKLKGAYGLGDPDERVLAQARESLARFGKVLDDHLAKHPFLVGDALTLADFAVGTHLAYRVATKCPLDGFSHILAWEARLDEIPAWRETAIET